MRISITKNMELRGRNLLTKLQLENRLQIEQIPLSELLKHLK